MEQIERLRDREGEGESFSEQLQNTLFLISPDLFSREVNNSGDEVLPHDDGSDLLPVSRALSQEQADGLEGQLHGRGWIGHGTHLHQVLLLNGLNSYRHQVNKDVDYDKEGAVMMGGWR